MIALEKALRREKTRLTCLDVRAAPTSRLGTIQAGPPFLLLNEEEDKRRLCSQGELQVVLHSGGSRGVAGGACPPYF